MPPRETPGLSAVFRGRESQRDVGEPRSWSNRRDALSSGVDSSLEGRTAPPLRREAGIDLRLAVSVRVGAREDANDADPGYPIGAWNEYTPTGALDIAFGETLPSA